MMIIYEYLYGIKVFQRVIAVINMGPTKNKSTKKSLKIKNSYLQFIWKR